MADDLKAEEVAALHANARTSIEAGEQIIATLRTERDAALARVTRLEAALRRLHDAVKPWLATADAGLPAVARNIGEAANLHNAQRAAATTLADAPGEMP
jgi:hypothetical protein